MFPSPFSCYLLVRMQRDSERRSILAFLRNREPFEHPRRTGGQADAGIAGGHSKNQAEVGADGSVSQAPANAHGASAFRPDRRLAAAGVETAVDFADHFEPLLHRPSDREAVGRGRRSAGSPRTGSARMPRPALPTKRIDCTVLPEQRRARKVGRIEAEAALVAGVWQLGGEAQAEGRARRRFGSDSDLGGDDDVLDVVRVIAA